LQKSNREGGERQRGRICIDVAAIMGLPLSGLKAKTGKEQVKEPGK